MSIAFDDELRTPEIEKLVARSEQAVAAVRPEVGTLTIKPQTPEAYHAARAKRMHLAV